MFDNSGEKIKKLAKIFFWICAVAYVIIALDLIFEEWFDGHVGIGLLCLVVGPLLSWIYGLFIYAFGEIVCNSSEMKCKLENLNSSYHNLSSLATTNGAISNGTTNVPTGSVDQQILKLQRLLAEKLITPQEYNETVERIKRGH